MKKYNIKNTIPINRPDISNLKIDEYIEYGNTILKFENKIMEYLNINGDIVMTSSGKMAIYLLFKILNLKGNIITSPLTCNMALYPIVANNLDIKFVDIKKDTLLIDEEKIEESIDGNTKAIFIINLGGFIPNLDKIRKTCDKYNLLMIEDCAQSFGSFYKNNIISDFKCFSFAKNMWLSGGGAVFSKNKEVINVIKKEQENFPIISDGLLKYRFDRDKIESERGLSEKIDEEYYNNFLVTSKNANVNININDYFFKDNVRCRPSNLQSSILYNQLLDIELKNKIRRNIANKFIGELYKKYFFQISDISDSVYSKLYLIPKKNIDNSILIPLLMDKGIDAKHLTKSHGLHLQERIDFNKNFENINIDNLKNYKDIHDKIICIPISSNLKDNEIKYIIKTLNNI